MNDAGPSTTKEQVVGGLFWMLSGASTQVVVRLLTLVVLARFLSPSEFGVVAAATVILGFAQILTQLGIGPALVQRPVLEPRHLRTAFTISMLLNAVVAMLLFATAAFFAGVFHSVEIEVVLKALLIVFLLDNLAIIPMSLIQRELGFRPLATVSIIGTVVYAAVAIAMAIADYGVWALVGAEIVQAVLKTTILFAKKPVDIRPLIDRRAVLDMLRFNGGYFLTRVANRTALEGDYVVVGYFLGTAPLGIYSRAYQLMAVPAKLLGNVLDVILFPVIARVQDRQHHLAAAYRRAIAGVALVTLPTSTVLVILAPELVEVVLGSQWHDAILPLQILGAGLLFRMSYRVSDAVARGTGAVFGQAFCHGAYAILVLMGASIGQNWGLSGVAAGVLLSLAVHFLLLAGLSLRLSGLGWKIFWLAHARAVLLTAVVGTQTAMLAWLLRQADFSPLITLAGVLIPLVLTGLSIVHFVPARLLGADGLWLLETLTTHVRREYHRLRIPGRSAESTA